MSQNQTQTPEQSPARVRCPAKKDPVIRPAAMAALFLGYAIYCIYDWSIGKFGPPEAWDAEHINDIFSHVLTYYGPFVLVPLGLLCAYYAIRAWRRVLLADQEGIGYEGGERVAWDKITRLDATAAAKGLLRLEYGEDEELVLDSYKLHNFKELVALVESKIPADRQERPK